MSAALSQSPAHQWFTNNLPEIQSRSRACLSRLPHNYREEAQAEVIGTAFKATVHAERNGVLANITPFNLVVNAVKQFRQGRRMAGHTSTDVMSERTQIKGRCKVVSLSSLDPDALENGQPVTLAETLADNRQDSSPFEETRRNLDYPAVLKQERVSTKARNVFKALTTDRSTGQGLRMAMDLKVSPGRVCQLKDELADALAAHDYATV